MSDLEATSYPELLLEIVEELRSDLEGENLSNGHDLESLIESVAGKPVEELNPVECQTVLEHIQKEKAAYERISGLISLLQDEFLQLEYLLRRKKVGFEQVESGMSPLKVLAADARSCFASVRQFLTMLSIAMTRLEGTDPTQSRPNEKQCADTIATSVETGDLNAKFHQIAICGAFLRASAAMEEFLQRAARLYPESQGVQKRIDYRRILLNKLAVKPSGKRKGPSEENLWTRLNHMFEIRNLVSHSETVSPESWSKNIIRAYFWLSCDNCANQKFPRSLCKHLVAINSDGLVLHEALVDDFLTVGEEYVAYLLSHIDVSQ